MKTAYLYVLPTMADWEPGYAIAELHSGRYFKKPNERIPVKTVAFDSKPVTTMGGVSIVPDLVVADISMDDAAIVILPGADTWHLAEHNQIIEKAEQFLGADIPVAAICGATVALANAGVLDQRTHTSNDLSVLKQFCPNYKGEAQYRNEPSIADGSLITASGIAPVEFATEIFKKLDVFSDQILDAWYGLYKTREPEYFSALMESLPE